MDFGSGFYLIEMEEKDSEKAALRTKNGRFEFPRKPFWLKNGYRLRLHSNEPLIHPMGNPKRKMRYLPQWLHQFLCFASRTSRTIRMPFQEIKTVSFSNPARQIGVSPRGSSFFRSRYHALISQAKSWWNKSNTQFPFSKTEKQLKGFSELFKYHRGFIRDFSKLTKTLTKCLQKRAKTIHNEEFLSTLEIAQIFSRMNRFFSMLISVNSSI